MPSGMFMGYGRWLPNLGSVVEAGLVVAMSSPGLFKVKRALDAPKTGRMVIQVGVDVPWSTETTVMVAKTCRLHGFLCERLLGECVEIEYAATGQRWFSVVKDVDHVAGTFSIEVWRLAKCETLEEARNALPPERAEAGFFLQVMAEPVG